MTYKLYTRLGQTVADAAITVNKDRSMTSFIFDENNPDYIAYLAWIAEGNVPEEA
jgi:hypothetical protein